MYADEEYLTVEEAPMSINIPKEEAGRASWKGEIRIDLVSGFTCTMVI